MTPLTLQYGGALMLLRLLHAAAAASAAVAACSNFMYTSKGTVQCRSAWQWSVSRWVTTSGYLQYGIDSNNDGAVLEVVPAMGDANIAPIPQDITSFNPVRQHWLYLGESGLLGVVHSKLEQDDLHSLHVCGAGSTVSVRLML